MSAPQPEFRRLSLAELLLDPNNARLIDDPLWEPIADEAIASLEVQARTTSRLQDRSREFGELVDSMRRLGWLDTEPVRVRACAAGGFVVLDGNRRVVALRELHGIGRAQQTWLPGLVEPPTPLQVRLEGSPDDTETLLAHGLRHTEHRQIWTGFSAAMWRRQFYQQHERWAALPSPVSRGPRGLELEELALDLCVQYRRSAWGDEFRPGLFTLFCEALHYRTIREWLGVTREARPATENLERFFSWVSRDPGASGLSETDPDDPRQPPTPGRIRVQPAIRGPTDLRRLASLLKDPAALERLDLGLDLEVAARTAELTLGLPSSVDALRQTLQTLQRPTAGPLPQDALDSAQAALVSLRRMIAAAGEQAVEPASEVPWPLATTGTPPHLRSLRVQRYRGLAGVALDDLGQVNLLVGVNNAGKTSILESIYLLSRRSDPRGVLDTLRARVRADPEARPGWLVKLLPPAIVLSGRLTDGTKVDVQQAVSDRPTSPHSNLATFLATLRIESGAQVSTTEFHAHRPRRTQASAGSQEWLARAVLHSPFSLADRALLTTCYERSIEEGTKPAIVEFIRTHVDDGVEDIELANTDGRFMVQHRKNGPLDLSFYGEGMQRVFEVSMLFAAHARGLVLIDEFENALHTSVLSGFSRMVHQLAVRFEVQVFLSTHSKETVDAFVLNGFHTENVVAFALRRSGEALQVDRFAGPSLREAIEAVDVDIRRL